MASQTIIKNTITVVFTNITNNILLVNTVLGSKCNSEKYRNITSWKNL